MGNAIEAEGLVKKYGTVTALDGLDLAVPRGTVMGLLGPNGAGKTTAVRVLTTLVEPDAGRARVAGLDVTSEPDRVRAKIGLSGQNVAVDEYLTGFENLEMIGRLYGLGARPSKERAGELLERFDLVAAGDRPVKGYSGGMRRRLDLAGALVAKASILFLDEPTTALDPHARIAMWGVIAELVAGGSTLLLTTQYLEEADRLAHRIVVVNHGKAIAEGTSSELKAQIGGERLVLTVGSADEVETTRAALAPLASKEMIIDQHSATITIPVTDGPTKLREALRRLDAETITLLDISLRRPSLDDVFLALTGHSAVEEDLTTNKKRGKRGRKDKAEIPMENVDRQDKEYAV